MMYEKIGIMDSRNLIEDRKELRINLEGIKTDNNQYSKRTQR